jgi:hypothetical protein
MKKHLLFCLLLTGMALVNSATAQEKTTLKNEFRVGYGMLTGVEMANAIFSIWPAIGYNAILRDTIADYSPSFYGAGGLEYSRHLKPWVSIGISATINPINTYLKSIRGYEYTWTYYLLSVMPRVDFYYLNKGVVSLYSGLQVGASFIFWNDKTGNTNYYDFGVTPAFHVNAFGIRIGKEIGGYMEWGYGFRGIVNFGVSAKF